MSPKLPLPIFRPSLHATGEACQSLKMRAILWRCVRKSRPTHACTCCPRATPSPFLAKLLMKRARACQRGATEALSAWLPGSSPGVFADQGGGGVQAVPGNGHRKPVRVLPFSKKPPAPVRTASIQRALIAISGPSLSLCVFVRVHPQIYRDREDGAVAAERPRASRVFITQQGAVFSRHRDSGVHCTCFGRNHPRSRRLQRIALSVQNTLFRCTQEPTARLRRRSHPPAPKPPCWVRRR